MFRKCSMKRMLGGAHSGPKRSPRSSAASARNARPCPTCGGKLARFSEIRSVWRKIILDFCKWLCHDRFMARRVLTPHVENASLDELKLASRVGSYETALRCTAI